MDCILTKYEAIKISNARKIVDTRNRIIHEYDSVSDEIIWGIVINHIPILLTTARQSTSSSITCSLVLLSVCWIMKAVSVKI
jgi:uncharacterized protein with HEPN domain